MTPTPPPRVANLPSEKGLGGGKVTRPILRYHGGKWMLAPWIIQQFPPHRRYIEPFGGGASVLLRKQRSHSEVYNDLAGEIVNVFRVLRDDGQELIRRLRLTPFSRAEFDLSYLQTEDMVERARRTIIRGFMGFGGNSSRPTKGPAPQRTGFRANGHEHGTVPAMDWMEYPEKLTAAIDRFRGVVIEQRAALEVIEQHDSEDALFFCDPPYVRSTRDKGADYWHEMTDDDHRALAHALNRVKGATILSGYDCDLYRDLYRGWERIERTGPFADGGRTRTEVLWMRNVEHGLFPPNPIPAPCVPTEALTFRRGEK